MKPIDNLLQSFGVKPTPQRVVITEFLLASTTNHPTADEILEGVQDKLPVPLSKATVYNTLKTLVEAEVIRELAIEPGKTRYDANRSSHHHFVDLKTGEILDISEGAVEKIPINLGENLEISHYQITFFGKIQG